jgi:hypothetical protein
MQEAILTHLLDILAGDARLILGGNAYGTANVNAWLGVKRPDNGTDSPAAGWVNLFDETAEPDSLNTRPAIYVGTRGMETHDGLDFVTMSSGVGRTEYRALTIPLVIAAQATTKKKARAQRNQLVGNVRRILLGHVVETGYWWQMEMPGDVTGGARQVSQTTGVGGTGTVATGSAEAIQTLPITIHYSFNINSLS